MLERNLVSAVMVNWNGAEHLKVALPSLKEQTYSPLEILVVDNGSSDNSRSVVEDNGVIWVPLATNRGLSFALNEGARQARGAYFVFLNNDMRFAPDFVQRLVSPLTDDQGLFATDAKQVSWTGSEEVHLATRLARRSLLASYLRPGLAPLLDISQHPALEVVVAFQACSAAMAVRRDMFEALEGFDERLLVSWEDTDLCWRAWLRGWRTVFVPQASCWHRIGGSTSDRRGAAARIRGNVGGRLIFASKHLPAFYALNSWLVSGLGVARDVLRGRLGDAILKARVIAAAAQVIQELLTERRRLYGEAGLSPATQLRRMLDLHASSRR